MPELPEVETIVNDLKTKISGHKILGVDSDWEKIIKEPEYSKFKKNIQGLIIQNIQRKGKNIVIYLTGNKALIIHLKMTGHPLVSSCWEFTNGKLKKKKTDECKKPDLIDSDPQNKFIHLGFTLDKGKSILLSDLRKFASVKLVEQNKLKDLFSTLGPDALNPELDYKKFKDLILKEKREIKKVLMDQTVISGIGNIYSDEILLEAKIHPNKKSSSLNKKEIKKIHENIKKILKEAIEKRGTSISDYRDTEGKKGFYADYRRVYGKEGMSCPKKCKGIIERIKIGGRSSYFCPQCQKEQK